MTAPRRRPPSTWALAVVLASSTPLGVGSVDAFASSAVERAAAAAAAIAAAVSGAASASAKAEGDDPDAMAPAAAAAAVATAVAAAVAAAVFGEKAAKSAPARRIDADSAPNL